MHIRIKICSFTLQAVSIIKMTVASTSENYLTFQKKKIKYIFIYKIKKLYNICLTWIFFKTFISKQGKEFHTFVDIISIQKCANYVFENLFLICLNIS